MPSVARGQAGVWHRHRFRATVTSGPRPGSAGSRSIGRVMHGPANTPIEQGKDEPMTTVLTESGEFNAAEAEVAGDALWLSAGEADAATGWVAKTEGLCRGRT